MTTSNFKDTLQFDIRSVESESSIQLSKGLSFRLAIVMEGTGMHYLQRNALSYRKGDLFIVAPNEEHHQLVASQATTLFIVQFSCLFITGEKSDNKAKGSLLQVLQYANNKPDYIVTLRKEAVLIRQLINAIIAEVQSDTPLYGPDYISVLLYTILVLIGEKIKVSLPKEIDRYSDQRTIDMLHYIHQNIFDPEKLTTQELSRRFFISQAYVGKYFKNNTSYNLHQYILLYKIKLIESRLVNSNMRISEIADEFGFTDKSYLNKIFMKHNGISPMAYRKSNRDASLKVQMHAACA